MDVVDVYYVGGFGVMGWVQASDYDQAKPDPLADVATGIIEHMNADHKDALVCWRERWPEWSRRSRDDISRSLGFQVRLKTSDGMKGARIGFLREVTTNPMARKGSGGDGAKARQGQVRS
jgi:heme iron utilization protein